MAKKYIRKPKTIDVGGLSINEIIGMDVRHLGLADLQAIGSRLVSASNKRLRNLQRSAEKGDWGKVSHAYVEWQKERKGEFFSTKGKNVGQLQSEIASMRSFLVQETSSLADFSRYRKKIENTINEKFALKGKDKFKFKDASEYEQFWNIYHKVTEQNAEYKENKSKSPILFRAIKEEMTSSKGKPNVHDIIADLTNQYESEKLAESDALQYEDEFASFGKI